MTNTLNSSELQLHITPTKWGKLKHIATGGAHKVYLDNNLIVRFDKSNTLESTSCQTPERIVNFTDLTTSNRHGTTWDKLIKTNNIHVQIKDLKSFIQIKQYNLYSCINELKSNNKAESMAVEYFHNLKEINGLRKKHSHINKQNIHKFIQVIKDISKLNDRNYYHSDMDGGKNIGFINNDYSDFKVFDIDSIKKLPKNDDSQKSNNCKELIRCLFNFEIPIIPIFKINQKLNHLDPTITFDSLIKYIYENIDNNITNTNTNTKLNYNTDNVYILNNMDKLFIK